MNEIQNTAEFVKNGGSYLILAAAMGGESADSIIGDMGAAGQRQLVASSTLPTNTHRTDAEFEAVGFVLGEQVAGDAMFRSAQLPAGWSKRGSDHDMWSYVVDERGRDRVAVFYKAAFYDRSAHMFLIGVDGYLRGCMHDGKPVITDETWATPAALRNAAFESAADARERAALYRSALDRPNPPSYAAEELETATRRAEEYEAIAAQYAPAIELAGE